MSISSYLNGYVSVFLIYIYLSEEVLGVYYILESLAGLSAIILTVINSWIAPDFAKVNKERRFEYLGYISRRANFLAFVLYLPVVFILASMGNEILRSYGIEYLGASRVLKIMLAFQLVNVYFSSVGLLLAMTGNEKYMSRIMLLSFIVNVILCYSLIPPFGLIGAALSGGIALVFWNFLAAKESFRRIGYSPVWLPFN
jgi:O-antigen/teichoic acid export membrane protein